MLYLTMSCMLTVALVFIRLNHPVSMGLTLIFHAVLVGLLSGLTVNSFLYSYILFIVILGGVLVLFIYMTSLVSNEIFTVSWLDLNVALMVTMAMTCMLTITLTPMESGVSSVFNEPNHTLSMHPAVGVMKLYTSGCSLLTLFLIGYLLFALLVCVETVGGKSGALRKFS